jgi:hypothetical protein
MEGGRIIGEGVDGCVLSEPLWPCSANSIRGPVPSVHDKTSISKIILKNDMEPVYRKAAETLLGPLARKYMTLLQGECLPADSTHPSPLSQTDPYKISKESLLAWRPSGEACGSLKDLVKKDASISKTHKVIYVSKYLMNVKEWIMTTKQPVDKIVHSIIPAIRPFMEALQLLYQQEYMQLIHIDLHIGNIFVNPAQGQTPLQFGLTDFGNCFLRRSSDTKETQAKMFFGKYLCDHLAVIPTFMGFSQVPLEAKLLNYCFTNKLESVNPGVLIASWKFQALKDSSTSKDITIIEIGMILDHLMKRPHFIAMVEHIQSISKKLRLNLKDRVKLTESLAYDELIVIEFILTRYAIISPINTITEALITLATYQLDSKELQLTVHSYFSKKNIHSKLRNRSSDLTYLVDFILRAIMAPYEQEGSSLSSVLRSVQDGDLRIVWDSILSSS